MLFHSFGFFALLALTGSAYWSLKSDHKRVLLLLLASIVFYANWHVWLVFLILFTAVFDFYLAQRIEEETDARRKKFLLTASIAVSLGLLAYFKYSNFLLDSGWSLMLMLGFELPRTVLKIVLPLGISFYTFETISYVVDVYLGRVKAERRATHYALFLMFFPHLIAGPIVRAGHFLPQVRRHKILNWGRVQLGAQMFVLGLFKKAVIADQVAVLVNPVFASPAGFSSAAIWAAVLCYAVQIYCDFSGYSDMAIGTAHMLGYKLPDNFNLPYCALNIADFWRRWHITLSGWLRDYLYIPLGGNRRGELQTCRNLMITMLLGGLWHGPAWTCVFWGFYHGALLVAHRAIPWPEWLGHKLFIPLRWAATFLAVCVGWVFFRAATLSDAWLMLGRMCVPTSGLVLDHFVAILVSTILALVAGAHILGQTVNWRSLERHVPFPLVAACLALVFLLAQLLIPEGGGAFIYFQF